MTSPLPVGVSVDQLHGDLRHATSAAMAHVPRHLFVPELRRMGAYLDRDLHLTTRRRCPRPSLVARWLEASNVEPGARVLLVGVGTGYAAACFAAAGATVVAVEHEPALLADAVIAIGAAGFAEQVTVRAAVPTRFDVPFDAVVLCGSIGRSPRESIARVRDEGLVVAPVSAGSDTRLYAFSPAPRGHMRRDLGEIEVEPLAAALEEKC